MNPRTTLLTAALLVGVLAGPALTVHALVGHIAGMGGARDMPREFGLSVVALVALLAVAPLVPLAAALLRASRSVRDVALLRAEGHERRAFGISYVAIESDLISMFTSGLRHPSIFVTSAAESELTADQLRAGLLHEHAHEQRGDVVTRFVLHVMQGAFGWLPGVRSIVDVLVVRSECAADRSALNSGADSLALFDAIVAVTGVSGTAPGLGTGLSLMRIQSLTDPSTLGPRVPRRGFVALAGWQIALPVLAHLATLAGIACATHV